MSDYFEHVVWVGPHDKSTCHTAKLRGGECGTDFQADCSCGFGQGTSTRDEAEYVGEMHVHDPDVSPIEIPRDLPKGPRVIRIPPTGENR